MIAAASGSALPAMAVGNTNFRSSSSRRCSARPAGTITSTRSARPRVRKPDSTSTVSIVCRAHLVGGDCPTASCAAPSEPSANADQTARSPALAGTGGCRNSCGPAPAGPAADRPRPTINTEGVNALTFRRVAQACGLSPMGVYRHIREKDDLLTGSSTPWSVPAWTAGTPPVRATPGGCGSARAVY